jgi:hypothetical protein
MNGIPDYSGIMKTLAGPAWCFVFAEYQVWLQTV